MAIAINATKKATRTGALGSPSWVVEASQTAGLYEKAIMISMKQCYDSKKMARLV